MMKLGRKKQPVAKAATAVTFSAQDLEVLGRLVAAGQAVFGGHGPAHPVVARLTNLANTSEEGVGNSGGRNHKESISKNAGSCP